jgi:hypothetical protein
MRRECECVCVCVRVCVRQSACVQYRLPSFNLKLVGHAQGDTERCVVTMHTHLKVVSHDGETHRCDGAIPRPRDRLRVWCFARACVRQHCTHPHPHTHTRMHTRGQGGSIGRRRNEQTCSYECGARRTDQGGHRLPRACHVRCAHPCGQANTLSLTDDLTFRPDREARISRLCSVCGRAPHALYAHTLCALCAPHAPHAPHALHAFHVNA